MQTAWRCNVDNLCVSLYAFMAQCVGCVCNFRWKSGLAQHDSDERYDLPPGYNKYINKHTYKAELDIMSGNNNVVLVMRDGCLQQEATLPLRSF